MIAKLQYISQGDTLNRHLENIERVCQAGCRWVQLRLKDVSYEDHLHTAKQAKDICDFYKTALIINDNVSVTRDIDGYGVHLGVEDMSPGEARNIIGQKIIGGTANTFEDCLRLVRQGVDYIGLGPLRFTSTKQKLSPLIGINGYREIMSNLTERGIKIPIVAIGGVQSDDVLEIRKTGLHGIAVSGLLTGRNDLQKEIGELKTMLL